MWTNCTHKGSLKHCKLSWLLSTLLYCGQFVSTTRLDSLYLTPGLQWWMSAASDLLFHSTSPHYSSFQIQSGSESLCHNECWKICFPGPKRIMCLQTHRSLFISRLELWLLALSLQQKRDGGIREREGTKGRVKKSVVFKSVSVRKCTLWAVTSISVYGQGRWSLMNTNEGMLEHIPDSTSNIIHARIPKRMVLNKVYFIFDPFVQAIM